ncbi:MAG: hypothetical protein JW731_04705 [Bacteroidales bacterium]|nr:hypothetical protein [Bacteroidales bacterium]
MHIYKFRLLSDIHDDFVRDIEIQATQTFENFHKLIVECANLNGKDLASFHICDQKWNKLREITLIDMLDGEAQTEEKMSVMETSIMKESKVKDFIDEPHQRLLYEYDFLNMNTLFIELLSVHKQRDESIKYPRCVLAKGEIKEEKAPMLPDLDEEEGLSIELLDDFDELLDDTFDFKSDNENTELS